MRVGYPKLGLSEQELRQAVEEGLVLAMHAEGDTPAPTPQAIAHAVARAIELDDLRIAEHLEAAGVQLERGDVG
jgi:hypothetical protein